LKQLINWASLPMPVTHFVLLASFENNHVIFFGDRIKTSFAIHAVFFSHTVSLSLLAT
jgi:hypothetical protein